MNNGKKYDNDFKTLLVELLKSGRKATELGQEYDLSVSMISRWKRKYESKNGNLSKKESLVKSNKNYETYLKH